MIKKKSHHTNVDPVTKIPEKSHKALKLGVPNIETTAVLAMTEHDEDVEHFDNTTDLFASWD